MVERPRRPRGVDLSGLESAEQKKKMRVNWRTRLQGQRVCLVPYRRRHVRAYHAWMQNAGLLEATASEPLSLEEEYEMQRSWREDEAKLTFIVLARGLDETVDECRKAHAGLGRMVGDVNLFFNDSEDDKCAEIEVMIAEPSARGRGIGQEALRMLVAYALRTLGTERFVAKIGDANAASLRLFQTKLGFRTVSYSDVFEETTLELHLAHGMPLADAVAGYWSALPIVEETDTPGDGEEE